MTKSKLVCPYGCTMNESATPIMDGHMNYNLYGNRILRFVNRAGIKRRKNVGLQIRWKNQFRYFKRVLC